MVISGNERQIAFGQTITLGRLSISTSNTFNLLLCARYIQTLAGYLIIKLKIMVV